MTVPVIRRRSRCWVMVPSVIFVSSLASVESDLIGRFRVIHNSSVGAERVWRGLKAA